MCQKQYLILIYCHVVCAWYRPRPRHYHRPRVNIMIIWLTNLYIPWSKCIEMRGLSLAKAYVITYYTPCRLNPKHKICQYFHVAPAGGARHKVSRLARILTIYWQLLGNLVYDIIYILSVSKTVFDINILPCCVCMV